VLKHACSGRKTGESEGEKESEKEWQRKRGAYCAWYSEGIIDQIMRMLKVSGDRMHL